MRHYAIRKESRGVAWYGRERVGCPESIRRQMRREGAIANANGAYSERTCEVDCFLTVLSSAQGPIFTMLDLGTGWGEWSMALVEVVKRRIVPVRFAGYRSTAVECDPYFCPIAARNTFPGATVRLGAISDRAGMVRINTGRISRRCCGSGLSFKGYFSGSRLLAKLLGIGHRLIKETALVPAFTIDSMMPQMGQVDLVVMDIQGAELLALKGAAQAIESGRVDWWLIGTHGRKLHEKVKPLLQGRYELVVDAPSGQITDITGDYRVEIATGQDGIQLWRRIGERE
ncbi:hypothetical protein LCGC14_2118980 [marine sediment metagenome]|uniref:Methyltransferase FkbM domain-containing protein n=1 Tax=marine sediment metagenome TaxID=412755 RepID=A0A0F9ERX3_9ZZZZ